MKQKVALALGSGGARGLAHIGVIEELENQGFEITSISGCSMGALIAGFYAMNKLNVYADWICTLKKKDVYSLMDITLSQSGLLKGDRVFNKMKELIPDMLIEEMQIPYSAVATDVISRKEEVFISGSFYTAARASIAIPAIITPYSTGDRIYVDGGVLDPVPVGHVKRTDGDILVAVNLYDDKQNTAEHEDENRKVLSGEKKVSEHRWINVNSSIEYLQQKIQELIPKSDNQNQGYLTLLQLTSSMMLTRISNLVLELNKPDIVINIPANSAKTFEFHKASKLIKTGREVANRQIREFLFQQKK
ncbi:NTE family protein [Tangfeifania diversioriginum]|uniref:NTE family protein n=1 Tax=Tangfeifania diversioriginum TaxID=1168035 RepID=A0A1M6A7Y0_9BACT|nr:patatin-like phospholipase family protein [Tangfeifania diversioriginum]SHI32551.1 NTE family protein [Tangfeifania diversioriginum]